MKFQQQLQYLIDQEIKRHAALKNHKTECPVPPYHIYVEPTNACFLKCVFCVEKAKRGEKLGYLPIELWRKIVDALAEYKILAPINIIGRGEPLMHRKLVDFVEYGANKGLNCSIITNGVILKKALGEKLIKAGIKKIQFSYHSHSPETYQQQTGFDYYDRVKKNILDLVETNAKYGNRCFINVMSVENNINKHESKAFVEYWSKIVDNCFVTPLYSVQGDSKMSDEAYQTTFGKNESKNDQPDHPGCVNPFIFFGFRYDGSITACPYDFTGKFLIANVTEKDFDLMKAWNDRRLQKLRKCHFTKDFSFCETIQYPCQTCDVPFAPDSYKGIVEYTSNFATVFSRMFGPILKNA